MNSDNTKEAKAGEVPEGCTPADAAMLRQANHALVDEVWRLKQLLRPFAQLARPHLSRAVVTYGVAQDPERQTFQTLSMHRAFNRAADALAEDEAATLQQAKVEQPSVDGSALVSITVGGSTHTRTADEWLALARADLAASRLAGQGEQPAPTDTSHLNCLEAQAIDRAYAICEPCNTGFPERCLYKRPKGEQPAPAADPSYDEAMTALGDIYLKLPLGYAGKVNVVREFIQRAALSAPAPAGDAATPVPYDKCVLGHCGSPSGCERDEICRASLPGDAPKGEGAEQQNATLRALLERARAQFQQWHEKYGEQQPTWLPPAGDVRWLEDVSAVLGKEEAR